MTPAPGAPLRRAFVNPVVELPRRDDFGTPQRAPAPFDGAQQRIRLLNRPLASHRFVR